MNITQADVNGLHEKLSTLNLTEGEQAVLACILDAASDDEVSGFAMNDPFGNFLGVSNRFVGTSFAESGKKGDSLEFAESGKKGESADFRLH